MKFLILLVGVPIVILFLLWAIGSLRIYHRTKLRSQLLFGIGFFLNGIGVIIGFLWFLYGEGSIWSILFYINAILTSIILGMAFAHETTKESGAWKEICDQTTIWQRIVGSVPTIEKEKHLSIFSKQSGLILGISISIIGALALLSSFIFGFPGKYNGFSILSLGLLLIFFSLKQNKSEKD